MDRRRFLQSLGAGALAGVVPSSIARALTIPANSRTRSLEDVEHIVILMQENRSFDQYFGTLRGVRGFDDPRAVRLPSGDPVWAQPGEHGPVRPFRPDAPDLGMQFLTDLPHHWRDSVPAWNGGRYDRWVPNKGATTMAYLTRQDIPYHYALADAFTVCDAYHCSFFGSTDPNRYHMWTGWLGNDGAGGGPVLDNAQAGYGWSTYPERLTRNGISWKIYQDVGAGLDAEHRWGWGEPYVGNYGDNSLLFFKAFQEAKPGSPLYEAARRGTDAAAGEPFEKIFEQDVRSGRLPAVSWIVAPAAYSEHGNWPTNYGAWYISRFLDVLTAHPEVWSKTAFFLTYDENDGFFDHVVPPTPPASRAQGWSTIDARHELFAGDPARYPDYPAGPFGLGPRVPMIVMSPWSRGGWVCSEVFDHTSLIRFIERRFAGDNPDLVETNITPWRRAVAGDLCSAFDFAAPNESLRHPAISLPSTAAYAPPDREKHPDYVPLPSGASAHPRQEPGQRPARPVPYELHATGRADPAEGSFTIDFANTGAAAAVFQVRSTRRADGPWTFTVGAGVSGSETWRFEGDRTYELEVHGPNGFYRRFQGALDPARPNVVVSGTYQPRRQGLVLALENAGGTAIVVRVSDAYEGRRFSRALRPGEQRRLRVSADATDGWYDLSVQVEGEAEPIQHWAGHVEAGRASVTDPLIGRLA